MRRLRPGVVVAILALAAVWVAPGSGIHDPEHPFAGNWAISFQTGFTGTVSSTGTFSFAFVDDATGLAEMNKIFDTAGGCLEPADYYVGSWSEGSVSGTLAGCGRPPEIFAPYTDSSGSLDAYVRVSLGPSGQTLSGDRYDDLDGDGTFDYVGSLEGTFAGHFPGDGAEPLEEPPPMCRTAGQPGGPPTVCPPEEPLTCFGMAATIVADEKNAGGGELVGTEGDDVIVGFPDRDLTILGLGGNDRICGGAGRDLIQGGRGDDRLSGGVGRDNLQGGDGVDLLSGGPEDDVLYGDDSLTPPPDSGPDLLMGGEGDDLVYGGPGDDRAIGGPGRDTLRGEEGDDRLSGGGDDDKIIGNEGVDALFGGPGDDLLEGDLPQSNFGYPDLLVGQGGDDTIWGYGQEDRAIGGPGDDTIHGGEDDDLLLGGSGEDRLEGDEGDDELDGGGGADRLFGGLQDDQLEEGPGKSDKIHNGGRGRDICNGTPKIRLDCEKPVRAR